MNFLFSSSVRSLRTVLITPGAGSHGLAPPVRTSRAGAAVKFVPMAIRLSAFVVMEKVDYGAAKSSVTLLLGHSDPNADDYHLKLRAGCSHQVSRTWLHFY